MKGFAGATHTNKLVGDEGDDPTAATREMYADLSLPPSHD
jgi:hypothetical protein